MNVRYANSTYLNAGKLISNSIFIVPFD